VTRAHRSAVGLVVVLAQGVAAPRPAAGAPAPAADSASSSALLDQAYQLKSAGRTAEAAAAFERARAAGADPQLIELELGYLASSTNGPASGEEARRHYEAAARGPDRKLADQARLEIAALAPPSPPAERGPGDGKASSAQPALSRFWGDVYAEAYGWQRLAGANESGSLVPTVRLRGLFRPAPSFDFNLYAYAQATRDTASRGAGVGGVPIIYADDYALIGGGALLRFWGGRVGFFGQIGPAFDLLDDGRPRIVLDARAGAVLYAETPACAPAPGTGAEWRLDPCLDVYAEGVYVSRFDDDVIAFARPRAALGYAITGPIDWQLVAEARSGKDSNDDYYNNFVDGGLGHRWRLLRPARIDLLASINGGTYFAVSGREPAPSQLGYVDARVDLATYLEF
jgi:hypothetical protein